MTFLSGASTTTIADRVRRIREEQKARRDRMVEVRRHCPEHGEYVVVVDPDAPDQADQACPKCLAREKSRNALKEKFQAAHRAFMAYAKEPVTEEDASMSFANFIVTDEKRHAFSTSKRFAERFFDRLEEGKSKSATGILMVGLSGTGKTHLSSAIYQELWKQGLSPVYLRALTLFNLYLPGSNLSPNEVTKHLAKVSCLIVDEVGRSACSAFEANQLLGLIDIRVKRGLPTILVTNAENLELVKILGPAFVSRARQLFYPLKFDWSDYRRVEPVGEKNFEEVF